MASGRSAATTAPILLAPPWWGWRPSSFALRITGEAALAWLLSFAVMLAAALASGVAPFDPASWARYDSGHYLAIANEGYELLACGLRDATYAPDAWCGNAGWFPAYPLLIRALAPVFGDVLAGFVIANGFAFASLLLLRLLLEEIGGEADRLLLLLLSALFPGGLYQHAVFPISMFLCALLLGLLLLVRGRFGWAALAMAAAAFTYSTGFLLAGVVGLAVLLAGQARRFGTRLLAASLFGGLAFAGFLAVLLLHQLELGQWDAFFLVQAKYGHGLHNPLAALPRFMAELQSAEGAQLLSPAQSLLMALLVPAALAALLLRWRQAGLLEWLAAAQVAVFWIFPLTMGAAVSLTRAEANLLPLVPLLAPLPRAAQLLLLVGFTLLRFGGGIAFFGSVIV